MLLIKISDDVIEKLSKIYKSITSENVDKYIRYVNKFVLRITHELNSTILPSDKFKLENNLAILRNYLQDLRHRKTIEDTYGWRELNSCFNNKITTAIIKNVDYKDPREFLWYAFEKLAIRVKTSLDSLLKVNVMLYTKFLIPSQNMKIDIKKFSISNSVVDRSTNLKKWYEGDISSKLLKQLEEFICYDSGWTLLEILHMIVNISNYCPITAGEYLELPKDIQSKKAILNIQNNDHYCILYCIAAALYPKKGKLYRVTQYSDISTLLNYNGITFPISVEDISKLEIQNNFSINVYTLDKLEENQHRVVPYRLSRFVTERIVNLLLLQEGEKKHFTLIKNMSRLLSKQISNHQARLFICNLCLNHFHKQQLLDEHTTTCFNQRQQKVEVPNDNERLIKFKNFRYKEDALFVIYADIQTIFSSDHQKYIAASAAIYVKCSFNNDFSKFEFYRGDSVVPWFLTKLYDIVQFIHPYLKSLVVPMQKLSRAENDENSKCENCHICEEKFEVNEKRVKDFCHVTGKYRGASHQACNLNYKRSKKIPVFVHNLSSQGAKFFLKELAEFHDGRILFFPHIDKTYMGFWKIFKKLDLHLKFLDMFRFFPQDLNELSTMLPIESMKIIQSHCQSEQEFELLRENMAFPTNYCDNLENVYEQMFDDVDLSSEESIHLELIWDTFQIKNWGEYADLCLKRNVLLLADTFEYFRQFSKQTYGVDPAYYDCLKNYAWECMLKCTSVELELLSDIEQISFIEKATTKGIVQSYTEHAAANNKYMNNYKSDEPNSFLMYFNINNLYAAAMSLSLPCGSFIFEDSNNFKIGDIINLPEDSEYGYILEVDLEYPSDLFNVDEVKRKLISPTNIWPIKNHVIHYKNLQLYMKLGLRLTRIHKVLYFKQSTWLKPFVEKTMKLQFGSENPFIKHLAHLFLQATFDQIMEGDRNVQDLTLCTKWLTKIAGAKKLIQRPNCHSSTVLGEDLVIIQQQKTCVKFLRPLYLSFCIMDLAKTLIYDLHYNYITNNFGHDSSLLYIDNSSLIYQFKQDIYQLIKTDKSKFDTSNYEEGNVFGIDRNNENVLGVIKDICGGKIITAFTAIRAKSYRLDIEDNSMASEQQYEMEFVNCLERTIKVEHNPTDTTITYAI